MLAFGLHMDLLGKAPFSAVGVVHIANRIVQHRPLLARRGADDHARACSELRARTAAGAQFDFVTEARVGDELVWEDVSRRTSSAATATSPSRGRPSSRTRRSPPSGACADDLGRRYAAVSGDHNPIHLHGLTAKAFGFPRAIAHGMWTKARCLAALRLPDAFAVDVRFKKPILLPSKVTFGEAERPLRRPLPPGGRRSARAELPLEVVQRLRRGALDGAGDDETIEQSARATREARAR